MANDPEIKKESIQITKHSFGNQGNSISINHIQNNWYTFVMLDHYDQNHVSFYLHKDELKGLADFIYKYLENNNDQ